MHFPDAARPRAFRDDIKALIPLRITTQSNAQEPASDFPGC
jgi:hypothetical protein